MSGILKRILVAVVLIPSVVFLLFRPFYLVCFLAVLSFAGMREFILFRSCILSEMNVQRKSESLFPPLVKGYDFQIFIRGCISALAPVLVYFFSNNEEQRLQNLVIWFVLSFSFLSVGVMLGYLPSDGEKRVKATLNLSDFLAFVMDIFGIVYTGGCLTVALILLQRNQFILLLTLTANWLSDALALLFGKTFGKYKLLGPLHKTLSPNKTMEGGVGATLGAILVCFILRYVVTSIPVLNELWIVPEFPHLTLFGILIGLLSIIGDLVESYIKRLAKVKDSGQFFASHGGVLDRLDGLLFTIPVVYVCTVLLRY